MGTTVRLRQGLLWLAGLTILSFGNILVVKGHFGVSVITSAAYVLNLRFPGISYGSWSYLIQGILLILLILIVRRMQLRYALALAVSVLYGIFLDVVTWILQGLPAGFAFQCLYYAVGLCCIALGVSLMLMSQLPAMVFDLFSKELSDVLNRPIRRVKTLFDLSMLTLTISLSLLFWGELRGVGIGTILNALLMGTLLQFWLKTLAPLGNWTKKPCRTAATAADE